MKVSKENLKTAKGIFKTNPNCDTLFVNDKGEFFTSENLAKNSVKDTKKELATITRAVKVEATEAPKTDIGSDDTGAGSPAPKEKDTKAPKKKTTKPSADDRIKTIEGAKTIDEVKALLKGEKATTVKAAGEARIVALTPVKETGTDVNNTGTDKDTAGVENSGVGNTGTDKDTAGVENSGVDNTGTVDTDEANQGDKK